MRRLFCSLLLLTACGSDGDGEASSGNTDGTESGSASDSAGTDGSAGTDTTGSSAGSSGASDSAGTTTSSSDSAGTTSASTTDATTDGTTTDTTGGGDGCGKDPGFTGSAMSTIDAAGMSRSYLLALPSGYDSSKAYPLIFAWHGRGGDGQLASTYFGLQTVADAGGGAIIVYPDGLPQANMGNQSGWDLSTTGVDVQLFDALLAELTANLCVDESRIFSTGHSFGGYFSNTLGCARPDLLLGIAPVAGGGPYFGCGGGVAAWITHGETDGTVPFSEGEDSRDFWVDANGCGTGTDPVGPDNCVAYQDCDAGKPVHWCPHTEVSGIPQLGAHLWPSFAAQGIWDFFAAL